MTRDEALQVYIEEGPDEAAKAAGVSVRTIYRWAATEGVSTTAMSEKTQAATAAAKERAALNRAELRALLIEQGVKALHAMDEQVPKVVTVIDGRSRSEHYEMVPADPKDKQALAMTAAILIDKYRLEAGEATERSERKDISDDLPANVKRQLRDRFADSVRGEAAAVEAEGEAGPATPTG